MGKFAVTGIFASPKGRCKDTVILSTFASFSNNFLQKKCIRLSANRFLYQLVTARLRLAFLLRYGAKLCQNFRHLQVLGEVYFSMADGVFHNPHGVTFASTAYHCLKKSLGLRVSTFQLSPFLVWNNAKMG
ncbi:hypothetical protein KC921_02745 [Candidatus Woesebacteria bacterium]|nr:hypothetical protein [Candidatus Woesebacteria bacterium]